MFTFNNDQPDDFLFILREVGQWVMDTGPVMWELPTLTPENLFDEHTRGNCYVMYTDDRDGGAAYVPAATFILQWKDPLYYPDVPDNTAGFIHKLAIRRAFAGKHFFAPILDFCRQRCLERNIHELQLETDATRPALVQFYERNGFEATYQKTISELGQTFRCQYFVMRF